MQQSIWLSMNYGFVDAKNLFLGFWVYITLLNIQLEINLNQKYHVLKRPEKQDIEAR